MIFYQPLISIFFGIHLKTGETTGGHMTITFTAIPFLFPDPHHSLENTPLLSPSTTSFFVKYGVER